MRVVILTSIERGFASVCLPHLVKHSGAEIVAVILAEGPQVSRVKRLRQITRKVATIGLRGAINGLRMRRWYGDDVAALLAIESLTTLSPKLGVPLLRTPAVNDDHTVSLMRDAGSDLALSLGNGWISPRVFSIPRHGMINVHHELLPEHQNAQSVIWSIADGKRTTGYTIHRVERTIDTGAILARVERPIAFRQTLAETVSATYAELMVDSGRSLAEVIRDWPRVAAAAMAQGSGRRFTTPTWAEYRSIERRFAALRGKVAAAPPASGPPAPTDRSA